MKWIFMAQMSSSVRM
jgi:acyl-CoA reductase-like NAD-dependent aldehyde dehydrogenase